MKGKVRGKTQSKGKERKKSKERQRMEGGNKKIKMKSTLQIIAKGLAIKEK